MTAGAATLQVDLEGRHTCLWAFTDEEGKPQEPGLCGGAWCAGIHISTASHPACTFLCPFLQFVPISLSSAIPCNPSLLSSSSTHSSGIFPHLSSKAEFPSNGPSHHLLPLVSGSLAVQHSQLLHQNVNQPFLFLLCLVESHWVSCTLKTNYSRLKSSRTYIFKCKSFSVSFWETHIKE